jgi:hypothetical protein
MQQPLPSAAQAGESKGADAPAVVNNIEDEEEEDGEPVSSRFDYTTKCVDVGPQLLRYTDEARSELKKLSEVVDAYKSETGCISNQQQESQLNDVNDSLRSVGSKIGIVRVMVDNWMETRSCKRYERDSADPIEDMPVSQGGVDARACVSRMNLTLLQSSGFLPILRSQVSKWRSSWTWQSKPSATCLITQLKWEQIAKTS